MYLVKLKNLILSTLKIINLTLIKRYLIDINKLLIKNKY